MTDFEKEIVERNEHWIKESEIQISNYKKYIEHEESGNRILKEQNRIMKGRY